MKTTYPFELKPLPYAYDALEPFIDKETMHLHHDKHHQAYVNNLNKALENYPELHNKTLLELLQNLKKLPEEIQTAVRNNGGGVFNHNLFFDGMTPDSSKMPVGNLAKAIDRAFGSFENFKETFKKAALGRFGSGWAWLVSDENGDVKIVSTANQDVPLNLTVNPILEIDVWEHAYYLKYQNRRAEYIDNWFNVIDWNKAEYIYNNPLI
ncbi:MAG TPA: superoxide dismutase [Acholeplasmataceae bacterium]|jgi:Fe-Mn family superoxide dismutase|nr:superoxide dismutase [Acholeplasmataceae bacterium]